MKKFVDSTEATNRGSRLVGLTIQIPVAPSRLLKNATIELSGDQRGFEPFHPGGNSKLPRVRGSRGSNVRLPVGVLLKRDGVPVRASQRVEDVRSPSTDVSA